MISARNSWLWAAMLGLLGTLEVHATEPFLGADLEAKIDAAAQREISTRKSAGVAVGVVRGGMLVFNRGYGLANVEMNAPVNGSTVFRLASLTKQFTAADVLILVDQKKLSLDDKLSKFYPDFPRGGEVTIRHLLTQTSGVRDYLEVRIEELWQRTWTHADFVKHIADLGFDFDPGTHWHYTNSGYYLLGQIIESVSGKSFADFTRENIYSRLGMTDSSVDEEADVVPFRASGYSQAEGTPSGFVNAPYIPMTVVYAAGATRSTVSDLAKWNIALHGGKVTGPETFKLMMSEGRLNDGKLARDAIFNPPGETPHVPPPGFGPFGYTMGLHTGSVDGHRLVGHEGGIFGFNTMMENYVDDGFTLIVLANTEGGAGYLEVEIARILFAAAKPAAKQ